MQIRVLHNFADLRVESNTRLTADVSEYQTADVRFSHILSTLYVKFQSRVA